MTAAETATVRPAPAETAAAKDIEPSESMWKLAEQLPCRLSVELKVSSFTVRDLIRLSAGSLIETGCAQSSDVPVLVNKVLVGWAEFEVLGAGLAARLTELA